MKSEISSKELARCAKAASRRAIDRAKAQGIPFAVQEGKQILLHHADGHKELLETLPQAYLKPSKKRYKIA
jgi:ribosomal protein L32